MIAIYKSRENVLEPITEIVNGCWINVVDPTSDEIERLTHLGLPQDFITYPLDMDERSRSEREDDGKMLILIRIPHYQGPKVDVPYNTLPLGIILTDQYIITVCRKQTDVIFDFINGKIRGFSTAKRIRFILQILLNNATKYLSYLRAINRTTEELEDKLQLSMQNREVLELLKYQKSLVYFTTALKSNELLVERLQRSQLFRLYPDDEDLLEDVLTENQQALEMVNISNNILSGLMDAFASVISNNLNVVMKFLASITIIMSVPTIITGFFGMNVMLPLAADNPWAPWIVVGLIVGASVLITIIFMKRDWF